MDSTQFMGMLIGAVATLLGVISVIVAIVIRPIISLNKTITILNGHIENLTNSSGALNERVTQHGKEIDANTQHLIVHDKEIEYLKKEVAR